MRYLKKLLVCLIIVSLVSGCAYKQKYILLPVEKYQFITQTGDRLVRQAGDEITLPVDGVWLSIGEKERYEHAQEWAVENGYNPQ